MIKRRGADGSPSRVSLEEMLAVSRALARPIAMFVDQSDDQMIGAAIDAGVSAYVVDGLRKTDGRWVVTHEHHSYTDTTLPG